MLYLRHKANKLQNQNIGRSSKGHSSEPGCFAQIILSVETSPDILHYLGQGESQGVWQIQDAVF